MVQAQRGRHAKRKHVLGFLPCRPQPAVELTLLQIPEVLGGLTAESLWGCWTLAWHRDSLILSSCSGNRGSEELEAWLLEWHVPVGILLCSWQTRNRKACVSLDPEIPGCCFAHVMFPSKPTRGQGMLGPSTLGT